MPQLITTLRAGDTARESTARVFNPGSNVLDFQSRHKDWQNPLPVLEDLTVLPTREASWSHGMPLLLPAGRVGVGNTGLFTYRGRTYQQQQAEARHGAPRREPWQTVSATDEQLDCELEIDRTGHRRRYRDSLPEFPYHLGLSYTLHLQADRLCASLLVTGLADYEQPVTIGSHPYLACDPRTCIVTLPARARWELHDDDEPTPTGRIIDVSGVHDLRKGQSLGTTNYDDIFTGLTPKDQTIVATVKQREKIQLKGGGSRMHEVTRGLQIDEMPRPMARADKVLPFRHIQLYAPKGRAAVSFEPLTGIQNALGLSGESVMDGERQLHDLQPGETVGVRWELFISVEKVEDDSPGRTA